MRSNRRKRKKAFNNFISITGKIESYVCSETSILSFLFGGISEKKKQTFWSSGVADVVVIFVAVVDVVVVIVFAAVVVFVVVEVFVVVILVVTVVVASTVVVVATFVTVVILIIIIIICIVVDAVVRSTVVAVSIHILNVVFDFIAIAIAIIIIIIVLIFLAPCLFKPPLKCSYSQHFHYFANRKLIDCITGENCRDLDLNPWLSSHESTVLTARPTRLNCR